MKSLAFELCAEQALVYKRLIKEKNLMEEKNIASLIKANREILELLRNCEYPVEHAA